MAGKLILISGPARSGKSGFGEQLAERYSREYGAAQAAKKGGGGAPGAEVAIAGGGIAPGAEAATAGGGTMSEAAIAGGGTMSEADTAAAGAGGGSIIAYLATAQALDQEMERRIAAHRRRRPAAWLTWEEPLWPAAGLRRLYQLGYRVVLLDCLTLLISNWLCALVTPAAAAQADEAAVLAEIAAPMEEIFAAVDELDELTLIAVTNEVGWSLVPENAFGRLYRDVAGRINCRAAARADQAWLVVMGLPQRLK
ncbi:MAG: bifunctional adenosylcobinamide kinase/adenosylcobinamide-phosphate guanylyltransferase [Peptococcaceae bacterium]|nr:bifunctional adenosylcobinamide kinase/adenosylcobinamide-phosphate guanylyltransferase [Peptococcaceae bacterium]